MFGVYFICVVYVVVLVFYCVLVDDGFVDFGCGGFEGVCVEGGVILGIGVVCY